MLLVKMIWWLSENNFFGLQIIVMASWTNAKLPMAMRVRVPALRCLPSPLQHPHGPTTDILVCPGAMEMKQENV